MTALKRDSEHFTLHEMSVKPHEDGSSTGEMIRFASNESCDGRFKQKVPEVTSGNTSREKSEENGVPYDRGWAWMIVLGCFVNVFLLSGYAKSNGIFFVELLDHFNSTTSHTALLFAIKGATYGIGGLFVMNVVVGRLGCKRTAFIGGLFMSLSAILASVANQLTLLICLQAISLGLADSMVVPSGEIMTATYFKKRRSLAIAIGKCGTSAGSIAIPLLVTFLLSQYGLRGTFLLTGAMCLHSLAATLLFRPISDFTTTRRPSRKFDPEKDQKSVENGLTGPEVERLIPVMSQEHADENKSVVVICQCTNDEDNSQMTSEPIKMDTGGFERNNCHCNRGTPQQVFHPSDKTSHTKPNSRLHLKHCFASFRSNPFGLDFSLFRRPYFRLLFVSFFLFPTTNMAIDYLPIIARENNVSETQIPVLLSIIGVLDFVSRLGSGFIADRKTIRVSTMVTLAFVTLGLMYHCVRFLTSFATFIVMAVVQGLVGSVANCMIPILIVESVGVENLAKGISFYLLASGSFIAAVHPLLGYIRDVTGSYVIVYHIIGSCMLLAAFLMVLEGPVRRLEISHQTANTLHR